MNKVLVKPLHTGVSVADMQESIDWYHKMLGFELEWKKYYDFLKCEIAFVKAGDFEIELFKHDESISLPADRKEPDADMKTQGNKHIAYEVEDITSLLNELKEKGADVVFGPTPMEGTLMGFIRDNTGNLIELIQKNI